MGVCIVWCVAMCLLGASEADAEITQTPSLVLERGHTAYLRCQQSYGHNNMFWYRQDPGQGMQFLVNFYNKIENEKGKITDRFQADQPQNDLFRLNISSVQPEDSAVYFCASSLDGTANILYFGEGTRLTVLEDLSKISDPEVAIFPPSKQEIKEKRKATLVCLATNFYPDHIKLVWQVNGVERKEGVRTEESLLDNYKEKYSLTSRLRISHQEWSNPKNTFQCFVEFYGNETKPYNKVINGVADCSVSEESYLRSAMASKSVYVLLIFKSALYGVFVMGLMLRNKQVQ